MFASHYQVIERLSRGGIGEVYRAFDTRMKREVAIKRLLPIHQTKLNELQPGALGREADTLSRFQHPNVVTLFSFEECGNDPYVVMELIDGINLQELIEDGAITVDDFKDMVGQLLDPLVEAQELGILHRDLNPNNIMVRWLSSGKPQFKILDFGISKSSPIPQVQTTDFKGNFLGTVDYLAPEQLEKEKLDQRADLYSLGCVLYFALSQKSPFRGNTPAVTIQNHMGNQVSNIRELRPDLPLPLANWLMSLLKRYPRSRPENAREAFRQFNEALRQGRGTVNSAPLVDFEVTSHREKTSHHLPAVARVEPQPPQEELTPVAG